MTRFVKLGGTWFRPRDIKNFGPAQGGYATKLELYNGDTWNVSLRPDDVAKALNDPSAPD